MKIIPGDFVFLMKDQEGLPFFVQFLEAEKKGFIIDWIGLIEAAVDRGWPRIRAFDAIVEGLNDSNAFADKRAVIIQRLQRYLILKS